MEWYPFFNTLRVAAIATASVVLVGLPAAYYVTRLPWAVRRALDVILSLPLVLPPTVTGWLLVLLLSSDKPLGFLSLTFFDLQLTMSWWSAVFAAFLVSFPFLYRSARISFANFDEELADVARTLGRSNLWTFWRIRMAYCWRGIFAGVVLAFARGLGEYGATSMVAGFTPGRTATISTTLYQFWKTGQEGPALKWILADVALSILFLLIIDTLGEIKRGGSR